MIIFRELDATLARWARQSQVWRSRLGGLFLCKINGWHFQPLSQNFDVLAPAPFQRKNLQFFSDSICTRCASANWSELFLCFTVQMILFNWVKKLFFKMVSSQGTRKRLSLALVFFRNGYFLTTVMVENTWYLPYLTKMWVRFLYFAHLHEMIHNISHSFCQWTCEQTFVCHADLSTMVGK